MIRYLLLAFFLTGTVHSAMAQSSVGTEFWLGYMENLTLAFNDAPAFSVIINADNATSGAIEAPATGLSIPFSVSTGSTEIFLPAAIFYSEVSEQIENKGLRIVADLPIRVQAYHYRRYFSESSSLLPVGALGTDYLITAVLDEAGPPQPSSMVVVATEEGTEVEITPSTLTVGLRPAGVPFTVTLDRGQNYQVQALGDLTGTRVRSLGGEPLAVFSGSQQADIIDGTCTGGADSHVWDQSLPVSDWRQLYYFVPFAGQGGDRLRIVAAEDNTTVFFDCESVAELNRGEFLNIFVTNATVISSTAPVSVSQYNNNFSCEPSQTGDPNGLSYLPADFMGTSFRWLASGRANNLAVSGFHFDQHYVTILGPVAATANVTLDGGAVTGFVPFAGNPDWAYTRVNVAPGAHEIIAPLGVQAYSYGFGFADAYTHHLGYTATQPQDFACLEIDRSGILCVDSSQQFTYTSNLNLSNFVWTFGDGNSSTEAEPNYAYPAPGTYEVSLTATDTNGVAVSTSLELTIVDCEEEPCSPNNVVIMPMVTGSGCALYLQDFSFAADFTTTSISWDFGDGSAPVNTAEARHFYELAGIYTVTLTLTNAINCVFTTELEVVIENCQPCFDEGTVDLMVEGTLCPGAFLQFSSTYAAVGVPPFELQWSFSDGQVASELNPEVSFTTPGDYTVDFFLFNSFGCMYEGFLSFTIESCGVDCDDDVSINFSEGIPSICAGETATLSVSSTSPITEYLWTIAEQDLTTENVTYLFDNPGPVAVELTVRTAEGCIYTASLVITVNDCTSDCSDLVIDEVIIDGTFCLDSLLTFEAVYSSATPVEATWLILPNFVTSTGDLFSTRFDEIGDYTLIFALDQTTTNCEAEVSLPLSIAACTPDCSAFQLNDFSLEGQLCPDSSLTLTPSFSSSPDSVLWQLPNGDLRTTEVLANFAASEAGPYPIQLMAFADNGCTLDTTLVLNIEPCTPAPACEVMIPNVFSPNEDGVNDRFRLFYAEECQPTNFELYLYNRWGNQVYRSNDPTASWDGRFNGKAHPQEVLLYWCRFKLPDGSVVERKGDVTLIR